MTAVIRALIAALVMQGCGVNPPPPEEPASTAPPLSVVQMGTDALYLGVWGEDQDTVWIVGGGPDGGVVAHYDGTRLFHEQTPPGASLWWVHGVDADRVWAVGEEGRVLRRDADGWREEETGLGEKAVLWGVWAAGPDDIWAVGGAYRRGGPKAVVLRSEGDGQWRRVTDDVFPADFNFYKVWGEGPDDVLIVGEGHQRLEERSRWIWVIRGYVDRAPPAIAMFERESLTESCQRSL